MIFGVKRIMIESLTKMCQKCVVYARGDNRRKPTITMKQDPQGKFTRLSDKKKGSIKVNQ